MSALMGSCMFQLLATQSGLHLHFLHVIWLRTTDNELSHNSQTFGRSSYSLATAILLDRRIALCALLGIRHQPISSLGIIGTFLLPQLDISAGKGLVILCIATSSITRGKEISVGSHLKTPRVATDPKQKSLPQAQWTMGMI